MRRRGRGLPAIEAFCANWETILLVLNVALHLPAQVHHSGAWDSCIVIRIEQRVDQVDLGAIPNQDRTANCLNRKLEVNVTACHRVHDEAHAPLHDSSRNESSVFDSNFHSTEAARHPTASQGRGIRTAIAKHEQQIASIFRCNAPVRRSSLHNIR